ncbi:MAG: ATP-binding protein [Fischerella sp. CENA71]|nr:ATP-binding protein [Fischerella sp. CENA71]
MSGNETTVTAEWLHGGGEMGKLIRSKDWSKTPLGSIESWPQSLRTTVSLCLASNFPINIIWGPGRVQIYNDGYWSICGDKHPHAMGQDYKECWLSAWDAVGEPFERATTGETAFLENRRMFLDRNGYLEETFLTFSLSPIRDETGGVGGLFHPVTEMTQQILTERRLQVLRDLADRTVNAKTIKETCRLSAEALAAHELDLPFTLFYRFDTDNKQANLMSMTGLELGSAACPMIVDLEASPEIWTLAEMAQSSPAFQGSSGQARQIDELEQRFGAFKCSPYPETPKSAIAFAITLPGLAHPWGVFVAGVSPRRALDEAYQTFYTLLGKSVIIAISNAHTYEEECKRAEALAELDRAKTAFFSNVSHEFRTPLTLLINPLEQVIAQTQNLLDSEQRELLDIVHRNGLRLLKLVNTLLDFSRIEAGRTQAVYKPTDLAIFTTELASVFRSAIETAGLQLIVDCPPLSNLVYVDREMWETIVLNLISNAFKFTLAGEIAVSLCPIGDKVELKIRDTGTGISVEELPRIFERFHQVRGVQARSHEGSGIGLALVQELVRLHGGTIKVESVLGKGTTFTVTLPTGSFHLPSEQISTERTLASTSIGTASYVQEMWGWLPEEDRGTRGRGDARNQGDTGTRGRGDTGNIFDNFSASPRLAVSVSSFAHILLVDDNADMRDYLKRLLSKRWQVTAVANGAAALNAIAQQLPDLVLTDVMMPEVDGFQLLSALRTDPKTKGIPIILLSARAGEEAAIEGLQAGADDYLIKPFSAQELVARIDSHLQMVRLRQELSSNRLKDEFLATVTHELHAPLVVIIGWIRLLRLKALDEATVLRALDTIERNAKNQAKLIEDLLDISTILSGKVDLQRQQIKVTDIIDQVINTSLKNAQAKGINIVQRHLTSQQKNIYVLGDNLRLQQIVKELLDNAIKFTPKGGVIEVRLDVIDSQARLQIRDTGMGISADFLTRVFDRFTQAEVPSRHSPGGLGLGLAIARQLVELQGGTIEAASEGDGRGATFTVKLPLI